jgi:hypothetical protein
VRKTIEMIAEDAIEKTSSAAIVAPKATMPAASTRPAMSPADRAWPDRPPGREQDAREEDPARPRADHRI